MKKILLTNIITLLTVFLAVSQSKVEWFQYAEEAFQQEDYLSAALMYEKILDAQNTASKSIPYPYDMRHYVPKQITDSSKTKIQTTEEQKQPSTTKTEGSNLMTEISNAHVYHQIAESYRLGYDYENAEKWYMQSVRNNSSDYPSERYWYALALMRNQKYDLAMRQIDSLKMGLRSGDPMLKTAEKIAKNCRFALDPKNKKKDLVQEADTMINKHYLIMHILCIKYLIYIF